MPDSSQDTRQEETIRLVLTEGSDSSSDVDASLGDLRHEAADLHQRIADLESMLKDAATREADTARQLDVDREHTAAIGHQLNEARIEAARLMIDEVTQLRDEMLAAATSEATALVDEGRSRLTALEAAGAKRIADLDTKHDRLSQSLDEMETIYAELQSTLQLVAETSVKLLVETQESLGTPPEDGSSQPPAEGS